MTRVVAVDPGGTVGIAVAEFDNGRARGFVSLELDPWYAMSVIDRRLRSADHAPEVLVVERFTITPQTVRKTAQYEALYQIGVLSYFAWSHDIELVLQQPSQAKGLATNAKLDRAGWRLPSKGGHRDDAARHLLTYALTHRLLPLEDFA